MHSTITRLLMFAFSFLGPAVSLISAADRKPPEIHMVRLYQPDDELSSRVGNDPKPLANYIKALENATNNYLKESPEPEAKGLLIVIGIKPGKHSRVWCEAVEGEIPAAALEKLEKILTEVPPIEVQQGPVAFAIELQLGGHKIENFPVFPKAWTKPDYKTLIIPDELFKAIWPD